MTALLIKIVGMSISSSFVAAAVILIKLLMKKAPRWIHCLLWALVAVRLVCPLSPESSFSIMPSRDAVYYSEAVTEALDVYAENPSPALPPTVDTSPTAPQDSQQSVTQGGQVRVPDTPKKSGISLLHLIPYIWMTGALMMAAYAVGSYVRFRRKVSPCIHVRDNLYICDYIDSPFILGMLSPRIYIPSFLTERETEYVAAHETAHIRRRDYLWKPIGFTLLAIHWFNPVMWVAYILLCRDVEIACDEHVVGRMQAEDRKEYTRVLLGCSIKRRMISACPLAFGEVSVKWRIKNVLTYKKPTLFVVIIAVVAVAIASVCLLTDPVSAEENEGLPAADLTVNETDAPEEFVPQLLTEVYYDIDSDGTDEYLVISDPTTMNHGFTEGTRDISIYDDGYKTYYNIFMPRGDVGEMYFELTDAGELKIARQYKGEWELSDVSPDYLREGRIVIDPSENITIDGGMIGAYGKETKARGMFWIDVAVIVDMGVEDNVTVGNAEDGSVIYGSREYIVVKPLIDGTQMFYNWEADTFRFWIGEEYTSEELQIGDAVKIVHNGGWGGSERELGPANGPVDISKMPLDGLYVSDEAYIALAGQLRQLKAELSIIRGLVTDKSSR